jgi:hypothetical protein
VRNLLHLLFAWRTLREVAEIVLEDVLLEFCSFDILIFKVVAIDAVMEE